VPVNFEKLKKKGARQKRKETPLVSVQRPQHIVKPVVTKATAAKNVAQHIKGTPLLERGTRRALYLPHLPLTQVSTLSAVCP